MSTAAELALNYHLSIFPAVSDEERKFSEANKNGGEK